MTATVNAPAGNNGGSSAPGVVLARLDAALDELDAALRALPVERFDPICLTWAGERAGRGRASLDRFDAVLAGRAKALTAAGRVRDPISVLDPHGRRNPAEVNAAAGRADTLEDAPTLDAAFAAGQLPAAHLDAIAKARKPLRGALRQAFDDHHDELARQARTQSLRRFKHTLAALVDQLQARHGEIERDRLIRRRSLRRWFDDDGMRHWHLIAPQEAAARLDGALDAEIEALFHHDRDRTGDDLRRTSEQLAHDALVTLVSGGHAAKRPGKAEIVVHIDHQTLLTGLHERSIHVDNNGQPISPGVVRRLACDADIIPLLLGGDSVPLDVGRAARTATPDQRRALAAVYPTCAVSDCSVRYAHCEVHHTDEWNDHGFTDLAKLAPLCTGSNGHHHLVHDHGWKMTLDPDRTMRLYRPDGTLDSTHRPPGLSPPRGP